MIICNSLLVLMASLSVANVALGTEAASSPTLTASQAAEVSKDVRAFAATVAQGVTQKGPVAWRDYFADSDAFFMVAEGHMVFANSDAVTRDLPKITASIVHLELQWGDSLRVDPPDVADVRTAGICATALGGHPTQMGGPPIPTLTEPQQAQAFVDARIAEGADYIKVIFDDLGWALGAEKRLPMLSHETLQAVIRAAHARGKLVVVHIASESRAREAIAAGADGLAHMFNGESAGSDFGRFMAEHSAFVIPTLSTVYATCGQSEGPAILADPRLQPYIRPDWKGGLTRAWPLQKASCKGTEEGLRQLIQAHVPILAGTDAPVPGTTYGASLHGELALLVKAGLRPAQALAAATSAPARAFHLTDRGGIRRGLRADLLLVEGDPTQDILATRNVVSIWKRGVRVQR